MYSSIKQCISKEVAKESQMAVAQ